MKSITRGQLMEPHTPLKQYLEKTVHRPVNMMMANKRLPANEIKPIQTAVLDLPKAPEGKAYLATTEFKYFEKIDDISMKKLDPHTRILVEQLQQPQ